MAGALQIGDTALTGLQVAQTITPATFAAGGALSAVGAAIPIIGAALAALPFAINIAKCGTIGVEGCVKEADTDIDKQGEIAARKVLDMADKGTITADQGTSAIAQIWQQMNQAWREPQRSGYTPAFDGFCGSDPRANPAYNVQIGTAPSSVAATYLCGQTLTRQQMFTQLFPAKVRELAAMHPSPAPQPVQGRTAGAAVTPSGRMPNTPATIPAAASTPAVNHAGALPWLLAGAAALLLLS